MDKKLFPKKIAVIGGGPAGAFTCHFLNKFAAAKNSDIIIDIFDYKSFCETGKKSCNMCAGIISDTLIEKLNSEKIIVPRSVIKNEISGYQLHTKYNTLYFKKYSEKNIYSVFRGQGPQLPDASIISFDQFLLDFVSQKPNVKIKREKVTDINLDNNDYAAVSTESGIIEHYDFVVGAFGVNTPIKDIIKKDYQPPKSVKFLQFEINLPEEFIKERYMNRIQMFPVYRNNIWFIILTPKWNFITVTVNGNNLKLKDIKDEILSNANIKFYLPEQNLNIKCSCGPSLPVGPARNVVHNRFLIVGDAFLSRYLKNGIESAYETAYYAADSIINRGYDKKTLKKYYYTRVINKYYYDNICGKILYFINRLLFIHPLYTEAHIRLAIKEQIEKTDRRLSDVFWDMFTGDRMYMDILKNALHPKLIFSVIREFICLSARWCFSGKKALTLKVSTLYKILNKSVIAIIGGGPAGASCAIKLAQLAKEKNLNIEIYLYERKDFTKHHNQCVGILSPPILAYLEKELNIKLPTELIKSEIPGYELHTETESVFLKKSEHSTDKTYSVRRSEFDNFLLSSAEAAGAHIINARVNNIEFVKDIYHDEVRIFSESNYLKADAVVCAFGLDSEMLARLNEATNGRYKKPKKVIRTFVTRLDYPQELLDKLYDKRIYAFLVSSIKNAEFGAITIKDNHIVVNIAGEKIRSTNLQEFLNLKKVNDILPEGIRDKIKFYCGRFPTSPARNPFGDRYAVVGDATGWLRPLKGKGINLAIITGANAAKVIMNDGISKKDFENYKKLCYEYIVDYKYGKLARFGLKLLVKFRIMKFVILLAKRNKNIYNFLYGAVSAENSYKKLFKEFFY